MVVRLAGWMNEKLSQTISLQERIEHDLIERRLLNVRLELPSIFCTVLAVEKLPVGASLLKGRRKLTSNTSRSRPEGKNAPRNPAACPATPKN
jgi:hypothetical protein